MAYRAPGSRGELSLPESGHTGGHSQEGKREEREGIPFEGLTGVGSAQDRPESRPTAAATICSDDCTTSMRGKGRRRLLFLLPGRWRMRHGRARGLGSRGAGSWTLHVLVR